MAQKREMATANPAAPAHGDLQWLELMAYTHGCCLLHTEESVAEAGADLEAPLTGDAGVLH